MDNTPARAAAIRDQQLTDLRATVQRVIPLLGFYAGLEAVADPEYAERLMAVAGELTTVLARTAPDQH